MEQIVVKTEEQPNGDILLFYFDENAPNNPNMLTIENLPQEEEPMEQQEETYIYEDDDDDGDDIDTSQLDEEEYRKENWSDEETQRLLVFFMDNKETFVNGAAKKKRLWAIACQTMITTKKAESCAMKLEIMKKKYIKSYLDSRKGLEVTWPYYNLCQVAFGDDENVKSLIAQGEQNQYMKLAVDPPKNDGIIVVKQVSSRSPADEKVEAMLKSYLKHKKRFLGDQFQKSLWHLIASEIGDSNEADYWHRRFLNFKQHYIRIKSRILENGTKNGPETIHWPYMALFDQIFHDDENFNRKYNTVNKQEKELTVIVNQNVSLGVNLHENWNTTEVTVLIKYFFDCFEDFLDPTIPNNYLWTEVGRLLDKTSNDCKEMYGQLKDSYLEQRLEEVVELRNRSTIVILFDSIVAKETELELLSINTKPDKVEVWKTTDTDTLVQFFFNRVEMFKDPVCYYVCWALVKRKLNKNLASCRHQWEDLTTLYKSILSDKKEYPDMQIDWRYTELFDGIFDYGTDENLMAGYEKLKKESLKTASKLLADVGSHENKESKQPRGIGDAKVFKILEFYLKNKDKFLQAGKKQRCWEMLSKDLDMPASEIDHRFRNLKQVYTSYIQREINKPEMPILWPYFNLCKKVFGYRAIKAKLKNSKDDTDEEWTTKEIKLLLNHVANNINVHAENLSESQFSSLSKQIDKTNKSCCDKFIELRKSYKKIKMMKDRNGDVNVTWKYYNTIDQMFNAKYEDEANENEIEMLEDEHLESILTQMNSGGDGADDDYTIIVIPENQDNNQAEVLTEHALTSATSKWNKRTKRTLLIEYIKYVKAHKTDCKPQEMWNEIASKLPGKSAIHCKKMFTKLKANYLNSDENERKQNLYHNLLERVIKLKTKSSKILNTSLNEDSECQDVELAPEKVEKALKYYLEHHEEFVSAKFDKNFVWTELASLIKEPVNKVFDKIRYLKKEYSNEERILTEFDALLKDIVAKENEHVIFGENLPEPTTEISDDIPWTDDEVEQLLYLYFANLDKFKNPKYVKKYLWIEVSNVLGRSPELCSKKMIEIRTQYRNRMKSETELVGGWRFFDLCQKIYGTGKKGNLNLGE